MWMKRFPPGVAQVSHWRRPGNPTPSISAEETTVADKGHDGRHDASCSGRSVSVFRWTVPLLLLIIDLIICSSQREEASQLHSSSYRPGGVTLCGHTSLLRLVSEVWVCLVVLCVVQVMNLLSTFVCDLLCVFGCVVLCCVVCVWLLCCSVLVLVGLCSKPVCSLVVWVQQQQQSNEA